MHCISIASHLNVCSTLLEFREPQGTAQTLDSGNSLRKQAKRLCKRYEDVTVVMLIDIDLIIGKLINMLIIKKIWHPFTRTLSSLASKETREDLSAHTMPAVSVLNLISSV